MKCIIFSYLVSATLCIYGGGALRDVRVHVPLAALRGHDALFRCEYELEADTLYAVKWYRGDREFYRYAPRDQPAAKHFPIPTINVNMSSSDATHLTLMDVQRKTSGRYSCEVSADAPSFHTAQVWTYFHVAEVPTHNPIIKGMKPRYRIGSILKANCTSRNSFPAANLTWVINNGPANPSHVRLYQAVRGITDLMTSITSIHFVVTPKHFVNGRLKVRCTAGIYNVYWKSTEKSASEERPPTAPPPAPPALESGRDALVYPVQESPLNASSCSRAPHFDLLISASICIVLGRIWNEDWPLSIGEM